MSKFAWNFFGRMKMHFIHFWHKMKSLDINTIYKSSFSFLSVFVENKWNDAQGYNVKYAIDINIKDNVIAITTCSMLGIALCDPT